MVRAVEVVRAVEALRAVEVVRVVELRPSNIQRHTLRVPSRAARLALAARLLAQESKVTKVLPSLFARWIGEWLTDPVPHESHATCDRCVMCAPDGQTGTERIFFDRAIKCCTYLPNIPNFLAGRILTDDGDDLARGRATIDQRITAGVAVTPFGLGIPAPYQLLYRNAQDFFGRAEGLRCPHYLAEGGRCGIWRHREATCATWFCKHEHGATGQTFWAATRELLRGVEHDLARWCVFALVHDDRMLAALAVADQAPERLDAYALDSLPNPDAHRELWGAWAGREREFFVEAARLVDPLQWNDVLEICGPAVRIQAAAVRARHRELIDRRIPNDPASRSLSSDSGIARRFHTADLQRFRSSPGPATSPRGPSVLRWAADRRRVRRDCP